MTRNGILPSQNKKKLIMVAVSIPWLSGIPFLSVRKEGQMAPSMTRTAFAPFMFWIANQKTASTAREMMARYEPQNPQDARAITGKGTWCRTPIAPFSAMTKEIMKKARATMPRDSRHVRP